MTDVAHKDNRSNDGIQTSEIIPQLGLESSIKSLKRTNSMEEMAFQFMTTRNKTERDVRYQIILFIGCHHHFIYCRTSVMFHKMPDTTNPPNIFTEAKIIAKTPIIDEKFISSGPAAIIAPTIITLEIALVTAISGV